MNLNDRPYPGTAVPAVKSHADHLLEAALEHQRRGDRLEAENALLRDALTEARRYAQCRPSCATSEEPSRPCSCGYSAWNANRVALLTVQS